MIATIDDCFRPDLPIEVVRAQARVSKLVLERGLPPRLLSLCTYLVSTTNLTRGGRVFLSRKRVAGILKVCERTIDRHFDELETSGFLDRQVRERTPTGWFYGTCVKWSTEIWETLFVAPGRTRREALAQQRAKRLGIQVEPTPTATPQKVDDLPLASRHPDPIGQPLPDPVTDAPSECNRPAPTPKTGHHPCDKKDALFFLPLTTVNKEVIFNNAKPTKPTLPENTFSEQPQSGRPAFNIPPAIRPWAEQLQLQPENISLLMATAKKTDTQRTQTRLQDLLNYVGKRLIAGSILGAAASKYLFKCLASGEDYSSARFNAPDAPGRENEDEVAARALRAKLPKGEVTVIAGAHLLRDERVVQRVDPTYGANGECHLLTIAQQAVLARRAGLVDVSSTGLATTEPTITPTITPTKVPAATPRSAAPITQTYKDIRTSEIRKVFLSLPAATQKVFLAPAMSHLKANGLANTSASLRASTGEWATAPVLLANMVTLYACDQYGADWFIEPK